MHKQKATVSRGNWIILPWWATEFCELARRIWQNLPWKTVGPIYLSQTAHSQWSNFKLL